MNTIHSDVVKPICEVMNDLFIYNVAEMKNKIKMYVKISHPKANPADTAFYSTDKLVLLFRGTFGNTEIKRHLTKSTLHNGLQNGKKSILMT